MNGNRKVQMVTPDPSQFVFIRVVMLFLSQFSKMCTETSPSYIDYAILLKLETSDVVSFFSELAPKTHGIHCFFY